MGDIDDPFLRLRVLAICVPGNNRYKYVADESKAVAELVTSGDPVEVKRLQRLSNELLFLRRATDCVWEKGIFNEAISRVSDMIYNERKGK